MQAERINQTVQPGNGTHCPVAGAGTCWVALADDTGSGILVVDMQGKFVYCNRVAADLLGSTPEHAVGKTFSDFFGADVAQERSGLLRRAASSERPLVVDGLLRGQMTRSTHRTCKVDSGAAVMMVITPGPGAAGPGIAAGVEHVRAKADDAGPLASLTGREMEILRLIGQGLSTAEIASELHRSVKTIEWHRVSLGTKLKQSNRVGLARVAIRAGLTRLDAAADRACAEE